LKTRSGLTTPVEDGQTPLDRDEAEGLVPAWIATRGDLNIAEQANIEASYRWVASARRRGVNVATEEFLRGLHHSMFRQVWSWAGRYRATERNIGVAPHQISMQVRMLLDDASVWHAHGIYDVDEQAYRLHHRLTAIHPFPNGNGRSARLMADHYLAQHGAEWFTWGAGLPADESRRRYLEAVRAADGHDYALLAAFVRA
jgi:Fic-DOC domain mobile mystery protein B